MSETITMHRSASPAARPRRGARGLLATGLLLATAALAGACSPPVEDGAAADGDGTAVVYHVRGQVTALPDPADPLSDLRIRHEAIDDFVSLDGELVGMDSMNMPFPVATDVDLGGVAVGDKVAFDLIVDWDADVAYQITNLEVLPADTELAYGKARPGGADGGGETGDGAMEHEAMEHDAMEHDGMEHGAMDGDAMDDDAMDGGGTASATTSGEAGGDG